MPEGKAMSRIRGMRWMGRTLLAAVLASLLALSLVATASAADATATAPEVIAPDAVWNGLFTFLKPELFKLRAAPPR